MRHGICCLKVTMDIYPFLRPPYTNEWLGEILARRCVNLHHSNTIPGPYVIYIYVQFDSLGGSNMLTEIIPTYVILNVLIIVIYSNVLFRPAT